MTVSNGALHRIIKNEDVDVKLKDYCAALIHQFRNEESKKRFQKEYKNRILTTVEARAHRQQTQHKLEEDESDPEHSQASATPVATFDNNPFVEEEEEFPTLKVIKEKKVYKFQTPANDLSVLKDYFDVSISTSQDEAKEEFMACMKKQVSERSAWCAKKTKDSDDVWIASNDFIKDKKDTLKLLDGVGTLADSIYLIMESSGFSNDNMTSHTLNDTLKNIKHGLDSFEVFA